MTNTNCAITEYRNIAGEIWPAKILATRGDGTVDLEILGTGIGDPVRLHARWDGEVWTKEGL